VGRQRMRGAARTVERGERRRREGEERGRWIAAFLSVTLIFFLSFHPSSDG